MKRKVIKQGHNTLTITLPKDWVEKNRIKSGDELDTESNGNRLIVSTGELAKPTSIEVDVSGLDRTALLFTIRSIYRKGYDEVTISFDNQVTKRFRDGKEYRTVSLIQYEVKNLIGYEIVSQKEKSCMVKDVSIVSEREFESIIRRAFLLLIDTLHDLVKGISERDMPLVSSVEERHDAITTFISYCMRLLSKGLSTFPKDNNLELYHVLASLDTLTDIIKYTSREIVEEKISLSRQGINALVMMKKMVEKYYKLFFRFGHEAVVEINQDRYLLIRHIRSINQKASTGEAMAINKLEGIIEIINDLLKSAISMNVK